MPKHTQKQIAVAMPQDKESAAEAIAAYARCEQQLGLIQSQLDDEITEMTAAAETLAAPIREKREAYFAAVQSFSETRRKALTDDGKRKFFDFTTGRVSWKNGAEKVCVDEMKLKEILATLRSLKLMDCIKLTWGLHKSELKKLTEDELAKIDGVTIETAPETFSIKPNSAALDMTSELESEAP